MGAGYRSQQHQEMFLTNLPRLGKAFLLLSIAMVESHQHGTSMAPPVEECCAEKKVGAYTYTLLQDDFHGSIHPQCLNNCVYTLIGTSSPKFCFGRGDLPAECHDREEAVIELVGGSGPHAGNVMIRGQPVCDDHWTQENADVVCRQLDYMYGLPTVNSHFGQVSGDYSSLGTRMCVGDEKYIWRCPRDESHDGCHGDHGAGVICFMYGPLPMSLDLVGGSGPHEGNLMIEGRPVCDEYWNQEDANVLCRQLGYLHGQPTFESHFGEVNTSLGSDVEFQCRGNEEHLLICPFNFEPKCSISGKGAGVICTNDEESGAGSGPDFTQPLELVGGEGPYEGNIFVMGRPVCDTTATPENAQVVCRQLGYLDGGITVNSFFGNFSDDFLWDNLNCTGNETHIWRCPHEKTEVNCSGDQAMGVICSGGDEGYGYGFTDHGPVQVAVSVSVKDATKKDGSLEGALVEITLLDETMVNATTNSEGVASFTFSSVVIGDLAVIFVTREGYANVLEEREISAGGQLIRIFASPDLAEGQHRLVLSWQTTEDLDIYALGRDMDTGEIVCKTYWWSGSNCTRAKLDVDNRDGFGPETITWSDAENDPYYYTLYVHNYDRPKNPDVAGNGAHIVLYGKTNITMHSKDAGEGGYWMLGDFVPSNSSFIENDKLMVLDPQITGNLASDSASLQRKMMKQPKKSRKA